MPVNVPSIPNAPIKTNTATPTSVSARVSFVPWIMLQQYAPPRPVTSPPTLSVVSVQTALLSILILATVLTDIIATLQMTMITLTLFAHPMNA
jgi:hypothetical protein